MPGVTYQGPIKSKRDALRLADSLERLGTAEGSDAASLLRRNWQMVAARPDLGRDMMDMVKDPVK